jgi:DtxR family Mn-dependent transcriptional regulator
MLQMMNKGHTKEEYLERLWEMKEKEQVSVRDLEEAMASDFDRKFIEELSMDGLVVFTDGERNIGLTVDGESQARQIIRAHRIGERLLFDVFGEEFEKGACEFEHTKTIELVDGICTLLGHPRNCPHGMPIPEGDCCRRLAKTTNNAVVSLVEMEIGQSTRVAYIESRDDHRMHKLNGLQIRPGVLIRLHQRYPCYVVECEGGNIALDDNIAASIRVWSNSPHDQPQQKHLKNNQKVRSRWQKLLRIGHRSG